MTIEILAYAKNDGWAFFLEENKLFLIRPPYIDTNLIKVQYNDLEKAVNMLGFERCNIKHGSISEVVKFLKKSYIDSMKSKKLLLSSSGELRKLLNYANENILAKYFEKIENELMSKGEFNVALTMAIDLMKLEKVRENNTLLDSAIKIIQECEYRKKELEKFEIIGTEQDYNKNLEKMFPYAIGKYSAPAIIESVKKTKERGQLLQLCL